jgi:hypothetical protein
MTLDTARNAALMAYKKMLLKAKIPYASSSSSSTKIDSH